MKATEVHQMNAEELKVEEQRLRKELYNLRAKGVTEKLENPKQLPSLRRDIARVLTERRQRQLKEQA